MIELSYELFCEHFLEQLRLRFGKDYVLEREDALGYNGVHKEMLLVGKTGAGCIPRFDLRAYYEAYLERGKWEELFVEIEQAVYSQKVPTEQKLKELFSKEQIRERLIVRLLSKKRNEELLKDMPHLPFLDLVITFHVLIEKEEGGTKTVRVTKKIWEEYIGESMLQMYQLALHNTELFFPARMEKLEKLLHMPELFGESGLFMLSNQYGIYGATVLLYEGVQKKIESVLGGDYYVIPSSVHEILVIQKQNVPNEELLKDTILEVNRTQVGAEDVLSNLLYRYEEQQLTCV